MIKRLTHEISDPKEKAFVKSVLEYMHKSDIQNKPFFTDFYNAEWMHQMLQKHIGINNLSGYRLFGGYEEAERQMLGFFPTYETDFLFPIACLKVSVKTGIGRALSHRDFLGALLGLGIERDTIGDIMLKPFGAYILIKETMAEYVSYMMTGIGRYHMIEIAAIDFSELEIDKPQTKEINTTVASLRIDAILSAAFGLSRGTCTKLIQNDKAKCNGTDISASHLLKQGDIVTLRGYGKIKLRQINGITKKERLHICIEKYI
ncbi:MAG: hypothetical protein K0S30_1294 [Clostridia bacterium]|jgi:RNA-binding protein YlmH|nr:hypothetical protein [Clostridia bacterium]